MARETGADLQTPLQEIHKGGKHDVLLRLAHFEDCKGMVALRGHVEGEQHGAVYPAALRILYSQVHTLVISLHVVAELRLRQH